MPAIAITGRAIAQNIRDGARVRFGRLTAALVVGDIAVSVAAVGLAIAVFGHATNLRVAQRATGIPAAEYLAAERRSEIKHEYFRGSIYAMAGASRWAATPIVARRAITCSIASGSSRNACSSVSRSDGAPRVSSSASANASRNPAATWA